MPTINPAMREAVRNAVSLLVSGHYQGLERLTQGRRLAAEEIQRAVADYPAQLIQPPDDAFEDLDVAEAKGTDARTYIVEMDLWTAEEGKSDLTLELGLEEVWPGGIYNIEVRNLHIL